MDNNDSYTKDTEGGEEHGRENMYHFEESPNHKHTAGRKNIDIKGAAGENLEENEQHTTGNFQLLFLFFFSYVEFHPLGRIQCIPKFL